MRSRLAVVAAFLLAAAACSQGGDQGTIATAPPTPEATPSSNVAISLREYSVTPAPDVGAAGKVTFDVKNVGKEVHEFVVVKTNLDAGSLPTKDDGSVDEDKVNGLGEVEDLEPGTSKELSLDLDAGKYVLICNRVETEEETASETEAPEATGGEDDAMKHEGGVQAHYKLGMRTAFTVR